MRQSRRRPGKPEIIASGLPFFEIASEYLKNARDDTRCFSGVAIFVGFGVASTELEIFHHEN